ncbi:MAG: FAD-dependent oxidoreductase [Victivallales bacterium]|nr:FAD-dependent oxidoreductase [Victivallales bacterium]
MPNEIKFKIDGREFTAAPGETILEVATRNGISIPTLCHNQKISRTTSCFVCVVKDKRTGKFLPSCSACPANGQEVESSSDEVRDMRRTALNLLLSEHAGDCEAPCTVACPAHAQVEEYVRAGRRGDFKKSLKIIKERIPLPLSISRVCPRFCEKECRRNVYGKPVAINDFKRLAADLYYDEYMEDIPVENGRRIAVVGAGPAGLSAAYFLRRLGYRVKMFEKMPKAGGMLRYGIPEYRLPKAILDREIAHFFKMGIELECNRQLGLNLSLDVLKSEYDAVAVTIGCWKAGSMRCAGEELALQGIKFLERIAANDWTGNNPGKTIVVGGGNTAMDCLRTSVRLGSDDVTCFYRRSEEQMPAEKLEIHEAKEEGVKFEFLVAPVKLVRNDAGKLVLTCQRMELGEPDASGRRKPVPVPGSEFDVEADTVIAAIGQATDAPPGLAVNRFGDLDVCEHTYRMSDNVFAAGDCVTGAATVVEGVAGGRIIALGIDGFLSGREYRPEPVVNVSRGHWQSLRKEDLVFLRQDVSEADRVPQRLIPIAERTSTFHEVAATFTPEEVQSEGKRCIECSCTAKGDCKLRQHSQEYGADPEAYKGARLQQGYDNRHPVIIHDRMKCIKCGTCVKICAEVVNKNLLSQKYRGFATKVEGLFGRTLPDSCAECGACVEECPVGALDWRFKA